LPIIGMNPPQESLPLNHDKDTLHPDWAAMHESCLIPPAKAASRQTNAIANFPHI
jgi:hypothetical protein